MCWVIIFNGIFNGISSMWYQWGRVWYNQLGSAESGKTSMIVKYYSRTNDTNEYVWAWWRIQWYPAMATCDFNQRNPSTTWRFDTSMWIKLGGNPHVYDMFYDIFTTGNPIHAVNTMLATAPVAHSPWSSWYRRSAKARDLRGWLQARRPGVDVKGSELNRNENRPWLVMS